MIAQLSCNCSETADHKWVVDGVSGDILWVVEWVDKAVGQQEREREMPVGVEIISTPAGVQINSTDS